MSTIEVLKLRKIENLGNATLLGATASSSGSAINGGSLPEVVVIGSYTGSGSGSGSNSGGAMGSYFAEWYFGSGSSSSGSNYSGSSSSGSGFGSEYTQNGCLCTGISRFPAASRTQTTNGECLAICIAQLLNFYGRRTTIDEVGNELVRMGYNVLTTGVPADQVRTVLNHYFNIETHQSWSMLIPVLASNHPVLSSITYPNDSAGHAVVITGYVDPTNNTRICYFDPNYKQQQCSPFVNSGKIAFSDLIEIKGLK